MSEDPARRQHDGATHARPGPETGPPCGSPCNSVCRMDPAGLYCVGCFRTLEEIAGWAGFDEARRRLIWTELGRRRGQAGPAAQDACEPRR